MKKLYAISSLLLFVFFHQDAMAQGKVLDKTSYVGALDASASSDWTAGWTNWDPKNSNYKDADDTLTLNGMRTSLPVPGELRIGSNLTLDNSKTYLLSGIIVVESGATLRIPEGTIIRALANLNSTPKNYACIVVERGGKIEITGSSKQPVVFTSAKPVGQRDRGDWGGILIAGKSWHNLNDATFSNVQMEGFNNVTFDPTLAKFGGNQPADNSGIIKYVRIEFAGLAFEANKEINALTLGAVGSATELHHVQCSYSNDDSFEWFGGTVNSKYLIAFKGTDDDFDTDNGYSGISQFGIAVRDSAYYDLTYSLASGASTSEGFESDNEATGTANVQPYTNAIFSNFTMIGPVPVGTKYTDLNSAARAAFRRGARIRRNSSLRVVNSIFMGYRNFLMVDGDSSLRNTNDPDLLTLLKSGSVDIANRQLFFNNNLIVNTTAAFNSNTDTTANGLVEVARAAGSQNKLTLLDQWVRQSGCLANNINPVNFDAGTVLVNPVASSTTPDFKPVAGSPALRGAEFDCNPVLKNFISSVDEINHAQQSTAYPNPVNGGIVFFGKTVVSAGLFDQNGRLIQWEVDSDHMNVESVPTGIYFLKTEGLVQKILITQ
ncbi:MAG: T9SS type A sorting domain-containing protein [Saprospiraceae bacterium]|nr:T9SS type A sorting domain-containing protein [Saprospiraceae bacterium]HMW39191.1 T9SS type A sorting domain-containing protein [Saprospiraceae bacterium]HMX89196.1 T9SS type A sorting domain-containing protein [Saprospiraceae bacterium]HMZ40605.1 T9SS type A sorting domain-containing protein [Saprospiraceae bacterium]HNA63711.1 T9SS type A sorting domain-containing protein [Saprospiraceae bacterium]